MSVFIFFINLKMLVALVVTGSICTVYILHIYHIRFLREMCNIQIIALYIITACTDVLPQTLEDPQNAM